MPVALTMIDIDEETIITKINIGKHNYNIYRCWFRSPTAGSWYTTYTRVPFYISSHTRSLAVESLDYLIFDMTTSSLVTMEINSTSFIGRIIAGELKFQIG